MKTNFQLSAKCVVPEEWKAGIGHDFRHYKGKMYRLLGLAPHSETLEPMAVYQLLYGDFGLWVLGQARQDVFRGDRGRRPPHAAVRKGVRDHKVISR